MIALGGFKVGGAARADGAESLRRAATAVGVVALVLGLLWLLRTLFSAGSDAADLLVDLAVTVTGTGLLLQLAAWVAKQGQDAQAAPLRTSGFVFAALGAVFGVLAAVVSMTNPSDLSALVGGSVVILLLVAAGGIYIALAMVRASRQVRDLADLLEATPSVDGGAAAARPWIPGP